MTGKLPRAGLQVTQKNQEVFVPLLHRPGEVQVDFGHALANANGQLRKVAFFVTVIGQIKTGHWWALQNRPV
jgi:hypothetical protein